MKATEASQEEWRMLFDAAIRYKQLGCWEWMNNDEYFAITDQETGALGFCVVLGAGGEEFGLNVYQIMEDPIEKRLDRLPQVMENGEVVWRDEWLPWHTEEILAESYVYPDPSRSV